MNMKIGEQNIFCVISVIHELNNKIKSWKTCTEPWFKITFHVFAETTICKTFMILKLKQSLDIIIIIKIVVVGSEVIRSVVINTSIFWDKILFSLLKINRWTLLVNCFILLSCLDYSSTLKMEATCSSETLVDFEQTTQPYIPKGITLQNYYCSYHLYCSCIYLFISYPWIIIYDIGQVRYFTILGCYSRL
jgi:hypothetical protein